MVRGAPDWGRASARQRFSQDVGAQKEEQKITVPKNTASGSPVSQDFVLYKGEVDYIEIRFPAGPAGLLHIAIFDVAGTTQLWPGVADTWYSGDDEIISIDTEYALTQSGGQYKLVIKGYNEDDTYPHSALVRAWVIPYPA